jgi:alkylation response protein AidB-like acyl-CoA dehydrogenase
MLQGEGHMSMKDTIGHLGEDNADFEELYPTLARVKKSEPKLIRYYEEAFMIAREFRHKVVEPRALEIDRKAMEDPTYVDADALRLACEYGLFSMGFPRMLGGQGSPFGAVTVACEEISAGCVGIANLIYVNGLAISCVAATFNLRWIADFADIVCQSEKTGNPRLLSTAITEPGAGSDVEDDELVKYADLCCSARPVQGGYLLNGRKVFISNGSVADTHVVLMPTDPKSPAETTDRKSTRLNSSHDYR